MELPMIELPLIGELQLVGAFIMIIVSLEIIMVFVAHEKNNPESSAAWLRVFIISLSGFITIYAIEFVTVLFFGVDIKLQEFIFRATLITVDAICILLFRTLKNFNNRNPARMNPGIITLIALYLVFLAIHGIELFSSGEIMIVSTTVSTFSMVPAAMIPFVVALVLHHRSDASIKRYYIAIALSIFIVGLGIVLHLNPIEQDLVTAGFPIESVAIFSVILAMLGISMLFVSFYMIPYIEDLFWRKEILSIYVLDTDNRVILYKELFPENIDENSGAVFSSSEMQDKVVLGGLSGLDDFMADLIKTPGGALESIDKGDLKFLFSRHKNLLFIAAVKKNLPVIKIKLAEFGDWFFIEFGELVKKNINDPARYVNAHDIILDVFRGE
jgi:hypothetical protein